MTDLHTSPAVNRPGLLPGIFSAVQLEINGVYEARAGVSQVSTSDVGDDTDFDGANDSGVQIDGAVLPVNNPASGVALAAALTALPISVAMGWTFSYAAPTLTVTFSDFTTHTVAPYNPSAPNLVFGAFSDTADAVTAPVIRAGMALFWSKGAIRQLEAAKPDSVIRDFAGVVTRSSVLSERVVSLAGGTPGTLIPENQVSCVLRGYGTVEAAAETVITEDSDVYIGRIAGEESQFFPEQDLGNTRLLVPGARWMMTTTGAGADRGVNVLFT